MGILKVGGGGLAGRRGGAGEGGGGWGAVLSISISIKGSR